ncbi:replication-relaxation family protein [Streptomyces tauricus]|uniref:replication-relaxation family protein n=1 Tax=Streptomyces tauricus TaxID=68274 RepID=UPI0022435FF8|nr:replication-relaxation family protein [Streptomyces tauricus]MCW8102671.1 replication-relaxation family protein [Streptomyces tauricus]
MRREQRVRAAQVVRLRPGAAGPLAHGGGSRCRVTGRGQEEGTGFGVGGSKAYPYGSTAAVRGHVLAALGVLKVATADQIHRLTAPGHKDNKAFRNALLDLARHHLAVSEGSARDGNKLWGLTPLGLDAAAEVLGRPVSEMGSPARGAARSGAPHAMAVNETVIAVTRTAPEPTRPVRRTTTATVRSASGEEPAVIPAARAELPAVPAAVAGVGSVSSWSTEVAMALPSAGRNRASVQTDAVLHAPEAGVPVLLFEVDNCTESADVLAGKFDRYRRFFRQKSKDHQGRELPVWRTLYPPTFREGYPPIAVVFNPGIRTGEQALKNRMNRVLDLTRELWSGSWERLGGPGGEPADGYRNYRDAIPLLFTTLPYLQDEGPLGPVWWRCGHREWQTLTDALANGDDIEAWHRRDEERRRQREAEREEAEHHRTAWENKPPDPQPAVPAPCERCGQPLNEPPGANDAFTPPDGRHCPSCRTDLRQQPMTLRQALFGKRPGR